MRISLFTVLFQAWLFQFPCIFLALNSTWSTYEGCYQSTECSKLCVESYHNRFAETCAQNIAILSAPLKCADYAQIHFGGPMSCGVEDLKVTEKINVMVSVCGCTSKRRKVFFPILLVCFCPLIIKPAKMIDTCLRCLMRPTNDAIILCKLEDSTTDGYIQCF